MIVAGMIHSQVPGAGHGSRPFGCQLFSLQPPEPGCQPHPALVSSGPRVLELCPPSQSSGSPMAPPTSPASPYTQYSILNTLASSGPRALRSSCPRIRPRVTMPACPLAALRRAHLCTGASLRFAPLHGFSHALGPSCPPVLESPRYATMPLMTFAGSTPVSRKSNPWCR